MSCPEDIGGGLALTAGRAAAPAPGPDRGDHPDDLMEASWRRRADRLGRRELTVELAISAALVVACAALMLASGPMRALEWLVVLPTLAAYVVASRVAYPLGAGNLVPTQPLLVALFAVAPPSLVPLLVASGFLVGNLVRAARGGAHIDRVAYAGGNAWHAVGPALVLVAAGASELLDAGWWVLGAALLAQLVVDLVCSTVREWVASGVRPHVQARVIAQIFAVDVALAPLGLLAAVTLEDLVWAPLALVPLVVVFAYATRDRSRSAERAAKRLEELQRERARLRKAVRRIGEAFASNLDLEGLLDIVTRVSVEALGADAGRSSTGDGSDGRLRRRADVNDSPAVEGLLTAAERRAFEAEGVRELASDGQFALACRIAGGGLTIGTLAIVRSTPFEGDEDRELLAYLCAQAGVAAANVLRHESLHEQALTDELTGLANHRRFQEVLRGAVERHARDGAPAALVLLDLDDFKKINDGHGHQTGDMVLRAVGACLKEHCRAPDQPARYGGEELAVVVDAGPDQAHALAERIRHSVADLRLITPDRGILRVGVSAGVAALGPGRVTKEALITAADTALYAAKRAGKNRVVSADAPTAGTLTA